MQLLAPSDNRRRLAETVRLTMEFDGPMSLWASAMAYCQRADLVHRLPIALPN